MDDRKNLPDHETLIRRVCATAQNQLAEFTEEKLLYQFNPGSVDLAPLLTRIVREMSSEMLSRQIYIQFKAEGQATESPASLPVLGEELLSYSMLNNLIKNAMEAAADGTEIDIDLLPPHREDEPGRQGMVQIRISNDGTVPREIREIFFEKFATSGKPGGTGLGTFSARLIAQTQGGDIAMETSDEQGRTTLTVNLPYALQADLTDLTDSTT